MIYYYTSSHSLHWNDISHMIDDNYAQEYEHNDVLVMNIHHYQTVEQIKEFNPGYRKIIIYQLEPLTKNHWWGIDLIVSRIKDADEVWDYDLDNIEILKEHGINAKYKPFVYSETLKRIENKAEPDIDVFFYGTLTPHRYKILDFLTNLGLVGYNTVWSYGLYKEKLDEFISRSKIILDLQSSDIEDDHIQKQSRIFYSLINNKCVVSEKSKRNYFGDLITESDIENLGKTLDYLLENDRWKDYSNVSERFKKINAKDLEDVKIVEKKNALEIMEDRTRSIVQILCEFGIDGESNEKGGTDKNTQHSYAEIYQELLSPLVERQGSLLDIGVRYGGSIILWNEFLPKFKIFGLEVEYNLIEYAQNYINSHQDKITIEFRDAYTEETKNYIKSINPEGFDVIIDDGPHTEESQVDFINLYLDLLKEDGILIIEDIQDISSVNILKNSVPQSELFDYEVTLYDRREIKQRYDDILLTIRKKKIPKTRTLHVFCEDSFANRYSCIIGGITLSRVCGLDLMIHWPSTNMCRAKFYDIFSTSNNINVDDTNYRDVEIDGNDYILACPNIVLILQRYKNIQFNNTIVLDDSDFNTFLDAINSNKQKDIFYSNPYLPSIIKNLPKEEIDKTILQLEFNTEIISKVNDLIQKNDLLNEYYGLHFRTTDYPEKADIDYWFKIVNDSSDKKYFICSDDPNIEKYFDQLPNTFYFEKNHKTEKFIEGEDWRYVYVDEDGRECEYNVERGLEHTKEAVVDYLLLAFSNPIRTSTMSTFFNSAIEVGPVLKRKFLTEKNKIAIFYHLYQTEDYEWEKLYHQQINSLIVSGLYDKCDFIHIGINGDKELPFVLNKSKFQYNKNKILEANTLQCLWEFCKENEDYKVLYFHSKGVTHKNNFHCESTTNAWRLYLEYFVIHNWKTCIDDLNHHDCVGTEWVTKSSYNNLTENFTQHNKNHYAGNFWWANASYVTSLNLDYLYETEGNYNRLRSEFWIGTQNPKYKSYHNSNKLLYDFYYSPNYYATINEQKSTEFIPMKNKVFIITPCTRPLYLSKISESIPKECEWIVVFDNKIKNEHSVHNATIIKSPFTGFRGYPNKNYGLDYIANNLNPTDNDWVVILHDDNIIHPNWWDAVKNHLNSNHSMITWGQCFSDETPKINPVEIPKIGNIDTAQYMVRWDIAKNIRYQNVYEADGIYAQESASRGSVLTIPEYLSYHNFLRSHKKGNSVRSNICMISMFKNESKGIRRMLESVWRHIDFYVFQDNGSTDGTPDIVREFFADKNIPGFIYEVEEGWVGFGWNRDHLLQTALRNDHGCDWIMKMDCDEYLEVDENFDWSPFYTSNKQAFNVTSMAPGCIYFRSWIWDAKLPWKFKHDVAHECIYIDDGVTGENFTTDNLPRGFRMIGTPDGESYTVRTKYISDALKLEEKLIREETMLTDLYHFWYTAKSYHDCYAGDFYPFGKSHSEEFARRAIYYYQHYIDHMKQDGFHEMTYFSKFSIGDLYKYLGEYDKAIEYYNDSERHCPIRNEHIVRLAFIYNELKQYDKMLEQTTRLMDENRKLPFPNVCFLLDTNIYYDSGSIPQQLHDFALSKMREQNDVTINSFGVNLNTKPRLWIVDDFYADPYAVREFALNQEFEPNKNYYKGSRSKQQFIVPGTKEAFEKVIGKKITRWTETHGMCGRFQYCTAEDDLVYHCDDQTLAAMIYLSPDAPYSCGTSLFAHKKTGIRNENDFGDVNVFEGGFYDRSKFELVDTAGNVFNRLVIFDAKCIHSANEYFGTDITNSRLFHIFFFD